MPDDNVRLISGSGTTSQILSVIHDGLGSVEEYQHSVILSTMAAAVKFDVTPQALLVGLMEGSPTDEEWENEKGWVVSQIENTDPNLEEDANGTDS